MRRGRGRLAPGRCVGRRGSWPGAPRSLFGAGPFRRVQCSGRRQGNGCHVPTFLVETVEDQIGRFLDGFGAPTEARSRHLIAWCLSRSLQIIVDAERIRLRSKLDRVSELYVEGTVTRPAYDAQREAILAGYFANVGHAWVEATGDERDQIARQLIANVLVVNKAAVAVVPRPGFARI